MTEPRFHGLRRSIPASKVREALGDRLSLIRQEDRLTWADVGEVLGKSEDQAAKYADGTATMDAVAYTNARLQWNGRFTGALDKLVCEAGPAPDGQHTQSCIQKAALALSVALQDGDLSVQEVRANRSTLENARDAIDAQLARLNPREVVNG